MSRAKPAPGMAGSTAGDTQRMGDAVPCRAGWGWGRAQAVGLEGGAGSADPSAGGQVSAGALPKAAPRQHSWRAAHASQAGRQSLSTTACRRLQKFLYFPHTFCPECPHTAAQLPAPCPVPRAGVGNGPAVPRAEGGHAVC